MQALHRLGLIFDGEALSCFAICDVADIALNHKILAGSIAVADEDNLMRVTIFAG